jgi:hypothetical protein
MHCFLGAAADLDYEDKKESKPNFQVVAMQYSGSRVPPAASCLPLSLFVHAGGLLLAWRPSLSLKSS